MERIKCLHCGWCCKNCPCHLAIYLGHEQEPIPCKHLIMSGEYSSCGLVETETNEVKKIAVKRIILSDNGCTFDFGPHPIALFKSIKTEYDKTEKDFAKEKASSFMIMHLEWLITKKKQKKHWEAVINQAIKDYKDFLRTI